MTYHSFGKIRCAHGIRGEVFLISFSKQFEWLEDLNSVRLVKRWKDEEGEEQEVISEHTIKKKKPHKVGYILKLDGITDRNQAEELQGYVVEEEVARLKKEDEYFLMELKGFAVFSGEELLGQVAGFSSNGAQDLLLVRDDKREISIPHVPTFILNIDFDSKKLHVNLPEGYVEELSQ